MKAKKRKRITDMNELTKNFEKLIKGKEIRENGKEIFEETIDKIVKNKNKKKSGR